MANEKVSREIVKGLLEYIKEGMPSLVALYDDWPNPSQVLQYPSLSCFTREPSFTNMMPYIVSKTLSPDEEATVGGVVRVVGMYEFNMQLDLWCETKFQRDELYEDLFRSFNRQVLTTGVMGISLQLANYYGQWARYNITGFQKTDSEEASQRDEWRVKISVIADVKAVMASTDHLIKTIENNLETPNSIENVPVAGNESII